MATLEALPVDPAQFQGQPAAVPQDEQPGLGYCTNQPNGGPLVPDDPGSLASSTKAMADTSKLWPNASTLHVYFLNGTDAWSQTVRQAIQQIAVTWSNYANIKFRFDQPTAHITVNLLPLSGIANYGTYNCYLGKDCISVIPQGRPSMNLVFHPGWAQNPPAMQQEFSRVILHEFGHSLGLIHEHMRPDRPMQWNVAATNAYFGAPPNNWSPQMVQQQIINFYQGGQTSGGAFDLQSIMMYQFPAGLAFYNDGSPFKTPNNTILSPEDKVLANMLYPPLGVIDPDERPLVAGDPPAAGSIQTAGQVVRYRIHPGAPGIYSVETQGSTPLLLSVLTKRKDPAGRMLAVEGSNAKLAFTATNAVPDYFVEVRHAKPLAGTGNFSISVRKQ
jgi:hypothetical protein